MAQSVLTLLLVLLLPLPADAASKCLVCHQIHYAEHGTCTTCHRGNDRTDRKRVAHDRLIGSRYAGAKIPGYPAVKRGKKLVGTFACRRCHTIDKEGNRLAANLDEVSSARPPEELAASVRSPVSFMPDFALDDDTVSDVVNAVLSATTSPRSEAPPMVVRFSRVPAQDDVFVRKCGACHRMLTKRRGGLGNGTIGPNLSGLLTPFYPKTHGDRDMWTADRLKEWIRNPRIIRSNTTMRPIELNGREWAQLQHVIEDSR